MEDVAGELPLTRVTWVRTPCGRNESAEGVTSRDADLALFVGVQAELPLSTSGYEKHRMRVAFGLT